MNAKTAALRRTLTTRLEPGSAAHRPKRSREAAAPPLTCNKGHAGGAQSEAALNQRVGGSSGGAAALPPGVRLSSASAGAEPRSDCNKATPEGRSRRLHTSDTPSAAPARNGRSPAPRHPGHSARRKIGLHNACYRLPACGYRARRGLHRRPPPFPRQAAPCAGRTCIRRGRPTVLGTLHCDKFAARSVDCPFGLPRVPA
jgi:hypothetical protein